MKFFRRALSVLRLIIKNDDKSKFDLAEKITRYVYPNYFFSEYGRLCIADEEFNRIYRSFMDENNYHSWDRKYNLDQLLKISKNIPGDLVEFGVYKGASAVFMCQFIKNNEQQKKIYLVDSFEGLSAPNDVDGDYWQKGDLSAAPQLLKDNLKNFDNFLIVKGFIPEVFNKLQLEKISFVHFDLDLYEPTLESLSFIYGKIQLGGILLFDDYGFTSCPGVKMAVDEFFLQKPEECISLSSGQMFIIKK